jgi:hypothetical protein
MSPENDVKLDPEGAKYRRKYHVTAVAGLARSSMARRNAVRCIAMSYQLGVQ